MNKAVIVMMVLLFFANKSTGAVYAYVPFEQLVSEAELIVTGVIVDKQYSKKESVINRYERSPVTNEMVIVESANYMEQFTDYQLEIDEVIKGASDSEIISIEAVGGCDENTGICMDMSSGYSYEIGSKVFILLKKRADRDFYQSTVGGLTAYLVTEDDRIYKYREELELIGGSSFEAREKPDPKRLIEIKTMVDELLKQEK